MFDQPEFTPEDSINQPATLEQWHEYVNQLQGNDLYEQALGANTLAFITAVKNDGVLSSSDITKLLKMFAKRLLADGQSLPGIMSGHYLSYADLMGQKLIEPKTAIG